MDQKGTVQEPVLLTDLLTRLGQVGETRWEAGDGDRRSCLDSETYQHSGDQEDARRMSHNPRSEAPSGHGRGLLLASC